MTAQNDGTALVHRLAGKDVTDDSISVTAVMVFIGRGVAIFVIGSVDASAIGGSLRFITPQLVLRYTVNPHEILAENCCGG